MPSLNKVILIGNLTRDPELRKTSNGISTCSFSIGVSRRYKNPQGQYDSDFINIVTWRQQAEFVCKYFHKGNPVCIVGSLQTRNYTNTQNQKVYVTEVVADEVNFVESRRSDSDSGYVPNPAFAGTDGLSTPTETSYAAPSASRQEASFVSSAGKSPVDNDPVTPVKTPDNQVLEDIDEDLPF